MEAALHDPVPTSTWAEDGDFYSENARIHIGPFKSPEHKLAAMSETLPPDPVPPPSSIEASCPTEALQDTPPDPDDSDDAERVQDLVGGGENGDGSNELDDEIPFSADYVDDEPSSALALRISVARDNPSPPPSPTVPPIHFELHSEGQSPEAEPDPSLKASTGELSMNDAGPMETPPMSRSPSPSPPKDPEMAVNTGLLPEIAFSEQKDPPPDSAASEVDALLIPSPLSGISSRPLTTLAGTSIPEENSHSDTDGSSRQLGDSDADARTSLIATMETSLNQLSELTPPPATPPQAPPLRRSPRKSVAASASNQATPLRHTTPRPSSRSPRKPKAPSDETVPDSQDESEPHQPQSLLALHPEGVEVTPRVKERSRSRSPLVFSREVGSLSPKTSNLLTDLIPSFTDATPIQLTAEPHPATETFVPSQPSQTFSVFSETPPEAIPSTPQRASSPMRPTGFGTPSPSKFRLQISQDPVPTPARRITMEKALETGQISPLKASQMGFTPQAPVPAMPQTPARRVLVTDQAAPAQSPVKQTLRFGSPIRGRSQDSAAPASVATSSSSNASASAVPSFARPTLSTSAHSFASSSANAGQTSRLPYPLVAREKPTSSNSKGDGFKPQPSISSPVKSTLKQPTSRIPRIGAKPYARPPPSTTSKLLAPKPSQPPASVPVPTVPPPKPTIIRKVDLSKPGTSRMVGSRTVATTSTLPKVTGKEAVMIRPVVTAGSSSNATSSSIPGAVKRKRSPDKIPSPVKSRMPSSRQAKPAPSKPAVGSKIPPAPSAALKQPRTIRKVVSPVPPPAPVPSPAEPPSSNSMAQVRPEPTPDANAPATTLQGQPIAPQPAEPSENPGSPMVEDTPISLPTTSQIPQSPPPPPSLIPTPIHAQPTPIPTIQIEPPAETPPIETLPPHEIPPPGVRRTGRLRKNAGTIDYTIPPEPRASTSRRKVAAQGPRFVFTDAYSEMSATALKQLTLANTTRNQHYLSARLETLVVRKDGARPESPMVKIKTIAQREMEQKEAQRTERAMRRARRSGESVPGSSDFEMSDEEGGNDELPNAATMPHTRGAGEDEDYKTPDRAFKRMKLTESGKYEGEDMEMEERRVKWDRGLFTTVYLDDVKLGTRQPVKELNGRKGCLASKAKSLRLDTLGNLEGDDPLPDVAPQHVTVKKFVYENEVYIEPSQPVVVEPPQPKVTRSRSKKAKS